MRKTNKLDRSTKLQLSRETIRQLASDALVRVGGGDSGGASAECETHDPLICAVKRVATLESLCCIFKR